VRVASLEAVREHVIVAQIGSVSETEFVSGNLLSSRSSKLENNSSNNVFIILILCS